MGGTTGIFGADPGATAQAAMDAVAGGGAEDPVSVEDDLDFDLPE